MLKHTVLLCLLSCLTLPALAQEVSSPISTDSADENSLLQEQAAICASYARVMEYTGLLERNQGDLWRERRFFAGAMLRQSMAQSVGAEPSNASIDEIIKQYSGWIIGLFSANTTNLESDDAQERDKLKTYISNFCSSLFVRADKAIAKVRPDLFASETPALPGDAPVLKPDSRIAELLAENKRLQNTITTLEMMREEARKNQAMAIPPLETALNKPQQSVAAATPEAETSAAPISLFPEGSNGKAGSAVENAEDYIEEDPAFALGELGMTQIQLAAYSTAKNARRGLDLLKQKMPDNYAEVRLDITTAKLASGKSVFRVISEPLDIETAKSICTHFWTIQYGCIIKMTKGS